MQILNSRTYSTHVLEVFNYYKQKLIHSDILDTENVDDMYIINQYALSETACELDIDKETITKIIGIRE